MPLGTELGLGPVDFVLDGDLALLSKRGRSPSPIFGPFVLWPNGWMHQDATWYGGISLSPGEFVFDGDPTPPQKGAEPLHNFGPCLLWPNCWMAQGGTWHGGGPWFRPHCARWGHSSPLQKKGHSPQFLAHVCCGQTAGWIKTPLGTEVDLGPGHFVLDGFPAVGERGTAPHLISAHAYCGHGRPSQLLLCSCYCCQTAGCIKMPPAMEVSLSPGDLVLDGDPASPPLKGHNQI